MADERKSPCFGCGRRTATCHPECNQYKEWLKEHIEFGRKKRIENVFTMSREHEAIYRWQKGRKT